VTKICGCLKQVDVNQVLEALNLERNKFFSKLEERVICRHVIAQGSEYQFQINDFANRLEGYIDPFGLISRNSALTTRFPLWPRLDQFLSNPTKRSLLVLGDSGSGKSMFAGFILRNLLKAYQKAENDEGKSKNKWVPVYIRLQKYSTRTEQEVAECIEKALVEEYRVRPNDLSLIRGEKGIERAPKLLVIMDGYDEMGSGRFVNVCSQLSEYSEKTKVVIIGRTEYFNDSKRPEQILTYLSKESGIQETPDIVFMSPFDRNDIEKYCSNFDSRNDKINHRNEEKKQEPSSSSFERLQEMQGLLELLQNPFTLAAVLQCIDQLEENRKRLKRFSLVLRFEIYQIFVEQWISEEIKGSSVQKEDCFSMNERLCLELFSKGQLMITEELRDTLLNNVIATTEEKEKTQVILEMIPVRWTGKEGTFIHKSVYEFIVAQLFIKELLGEELSKEPNLKLWESRVLSRDERSIMKFIAEAVKLERQDSPNGKCWWEENEQNQSSHSLQSRLLNMISSTRGTKGNAKGGNAASVLNYSGFQFSTMDLSDVSIPGADLRNSNLHRTKLNKAELCSIISGRTAVSKFSGSYMNEANLDHAVFGVPNELGKVEDCEFDQLPGFKGASSLFALSPDGRKIVSGAEKIIRIWNVNTGECEKELQGHTDDISCLNFSPDGERFVSGSKDKTVRIWKVSGEHERTIEGFDRPPNNVEFSPDGTKILSSSQNGPLYIHDTTSGNRDFNRTSQPPAYLAIYSSDGKIASAQSVVSTLQIRSPSLDLVKDVEWPGSILCMAFSPNGKKVASGGWDGTVFVVDIESGKCEHTLTGHCQYVQSVVFSPNNTKLVSGSDDGAVRIWDLSTGLCERVIQGDMDSVKKVTFSPDGTKLFSGSPDGIRIWSLAQSDAENPDGHSDGILRVAFSPDGSHIASVSSDSVRIWNSVSGICETILQGQGDVAFSPDGTKIACASKDYKIQVWNLVTRKWEFTLSGHENNVEYLQFSPDGSKILSMSPYPESAYRLWDTISHQCELKKPHFGIFTRPFFLNGEPRFSSITNHKNALDISDSTGKRGNVYINLPSGFQCRSFSPDGTKLATAFQDEMLRIWNTTTGQEIDKMQVPLVLEGLSFSSDGTKIAWVNDRLISIWNMQTRKVETFDHTHPRSVRTLSFSPDGTKLVTSSDDRSIRVWELLSSSDNQSSKIRLLWAGPQNSLSCEGSSAVDLLNITDSNLVLLKQLGATASRGNQDLQDSSQKEFKMSFSKSGDRWSYVLQENGATVEGELSGDNDPQKQNLIEQLSLIESSIRKYWGTSSSEVSLTK